MAVLRQNKKHKSFAKFMILPGVATGDQTPKRMNARDKKKERWVLPYHN
jgi:hypothetical protein